MFLQQIIWTQSLKLTYIYIYALLTVKYNAHQFAWTPRFIVIPAQLLTVLCRSWEWITFINTIYILLGEPCALIFGSFKKIVTRSFEKMYDYNCECINTCNVQKQYVSSLGHNFYEMISFCLLSMPPFHFVVRQCEQYGDFANQREWWCRSADEHQWTCVHRVWAPTNAAKRDWASYNRHKACGFRTNAANESPLDQFWS